MKRIFIIIIILLIVIYALLHLKVILLYRPMSASDDKYIRFHQKLLQLIDSSDSSDLLRNDFVKTIDDISLDTVYIRNPHSDMCIIFFHGNAGNLSMRFDMVKFLYNFCSVIIFDYRSYGKSTGNSGDLSCSNLQIDAEAIWNYTINVLKYKSSQVSLFGESLGCSVAILLAANLSKTLNSAYYPHSIILNSPFYSLASMVEITLDKIGIGIIGSVLSCFVCYEYRSNEWIQYINHYTKIIMAHSTRDEVIPYTEGIKLFNSISKNRDNIRFINITGTHNNLGLTDEYMYALSDLYQ